MNCRRRPLGRGRASVLGVGVARPERSVRRVSHSKRQCQILYEAVTRGRDMIPFAGAATVPFSEVPIGHLVTLGPPFSPVIALRIQLIQAPANHAAVMFEAGAPPTYVHFDENPLCLDLGKFAVVRVPFDAAQFSTDHNYSTPGNLAIQGSSTCIIALLQQSRGASPRKLLFEATTGKQVDGTYDQWFVRSWQLGVADDTRFHKVFEWPVPKEAATTL